MAKYTNKNNALGMFKGVKPVSVVSPAEKTADRKAEKNPEKVVEIVPEAEPLAEEESTDIKAAETPPVETAPAAKPVGKAEKNISVTMDKSRHVDRKTQKTFYIHESIHEKLRQRAEENNAGISEYLEFILEQVL